VLAAVFARSFLIQAGFNPRAMQGLGYVYALFPALDALYADRARTDAVKRHLGHFNTHPYFAAAILGGTLRLEERIAAGIAAPESVHRFRDALSAPLAAIGDTFFWSALRPACALLAALTAPTLGAGAVVVFLLLYNIVHLTVRTWLFVVGYRRPEGLVAAVGQARFPSGAVLLRRACAVMAGALAAQLVLIAGRHGGGTAAAWAALAALGGVLLAGRVNVYLLAYAALALAIVAGIVLR